MSEPAGLYHPTPFSGIASRNRKVATTRGDETTATLHILPLRSTREPAVHEWALVRQRLGQLASLPNHWNGGIGVSPDLQTISFAGQQLASLQQQGLPAPAINPSPDGAIYAEWHTRGLDIELIFEAPYQVIVLAEDARAEFPPLETEGSDVTIAYGPLKALCAR